MSDLDDRLIIHVFGETDFTSFSIRREAFEGMPKVFDTPEGDDYVQVIGTLFGQDNWDQLRERKAENGSSFEELVADSLVHLVADTETVNTALQAGHNLIALGVFRSASQPDDTPVYNARFLGISSTTTTDPNAHLDLVRQGIQHAAAFIEDDIEKGKFAPDSVIARMVDPDSAEAEDDGEELVELPQAVFFHEMVTQSGLETVILCACDRDLAAAAGEATDFVVGLVSGIVPTPHGSVGYWLWQVGPDTTHGFTQEQFVDLHAFPSETYDRMKRSDTVRFLIVDRETHENTRAVLLKRDSIGLQEFETMATEVAASEPEADFEAACEHVMNTVDPQEFLRQTREQEQKGKTNLH
ncbi:hypothetical protein ROJ8625_03317 [Roseivivax jejudonensis]|uniref:Uncharacterized protein n=1 Tax=Roseivivax jejudonensis TaxID=1529041 RepID=A0A1X6ZYI7_9RHOB|nr:hypothetical protein [Roseivivax jejudonensis]SLN65100.1 hypothetical protein ROJ8625_03317 [Roseivivax jejudonensis]